MNCLQLQKRMADYLGEEMAPQDRRVFEAHLRECMPCMMEWESLAGTVAALRRLETVTPAQARHSIRQLRVVRASPWGRRVVMSLLKTAAVLVLGAGIGRYTAPDSPATDSAPAPNASRSSAPAEPTIHPGWIELGRKAHLVRSHLLSELMTDHFPG